MSNHSSSLNVDNNETARTSPLSSPPLINTQNSRVSPDTHLGTLEFCAALNGDDPELVRVLLKKFIVLVRKERRQALVECESSSKDEKEEYIRYYGELDTMGNNQTQQEEKYPSKKKIKLESWKLDSKAYNVPFVGTSIQKGCKGSVVKNEWPTGFMKAYLEVSPSAQEIFQSMKYFAPSEELFTMDSHRKRKFAQTFQLQLLYIQAFGEILTCSMPREQLLTMVHSSSPSSWKAYVVNNSSHHSSIDTLPTPYDQIPFMKGIRDKLSYLLRIINDITTSRIEQEQVKKGKVPHPDTSFLSEEQSQVAIAALITITHYASTSVHAARDVARGLNIMVRESVFVALMRSHSPRPNSRSLSAKAEIKRENTGSCASACLHLAAVLLDAYDSVVFSLISNLANKERKIGPGLLYHVLRWGLSSDKLRVDAITDDIYLIGVYRFLKSLREFLSYKDTPSTTGVHVDQRKSASFNGNRTMLHLLKDDPLLRLCDFSLNTKSSQIRQDMNMLECAAVEGRKLLFLCLIDAQSSPFLRVIHSTRALDAGLHKSLAHQLTRCIHMLVSSTYDTYLKEMIVKYFNNSPLLLPYYFRSVSLPEPSPSFAFLAQISCIRTLLEKGPKPSKRLRDDLPGWPNDSDDFMLWIIPSRFSKNFLTKSIQSSNAFIVSHVLKLLTSILRRAALCACDMHDEKLALISDHLQRRLPNLQNLLALRSRFNPYQVASQSQHHNASARTTDTDSKLLIIFYLCGVLQHYRSLFEASTLATQYDWTKLLPDNPESFKTTPTWFQSRLIETLTLVYGTGQSVSTVSCTLGPKTIQVLMQIRQDSIHPHIDQLIRTALGKLLFMLLRSSNGNCLTFEQNLCLRYECRLWVQTFTRDNISRYIKHIEVAQQNSIQHALSTYMCWVKKFANRKAPSLCFSSLLSVSLNSMVTNLNILKLDDVQALCNLTVKLLNFQAYPHLLALFITQALNIEHVATEVISADEEAKRKIVLNLRQYTLNRFIFRYQSGRCYDLSANEEHNAREDFQTKPSSDCTIIRNETNRTKATSIFSLSDPQFSSLASLRRLIRNSNFTTDCKDEIAVKGCFISLRRSLIYILLADANKPRLLINSWFSILEKMPFPCTESNITMWLLFASIAPVCLYPEYGYVWRKKCLSVLEKYTRESAIQNKSETSIFLSSLSLTKYSPCDFIVNSTESILSTIDLSAGDDFPSLYRVALAIVYEFFFNNETNYANNYSGFPFDFALKLWLKLPKTEYHGLIHSIRCRLEDLIETTLRRGDGLESCHLISMVRQSDFTERMLASIYQGKYKLLNACLKYDLFSFAHAVTKGLLGDCSGDIMIRGLLASTIISELEYQEKGRKEFLLNEELRDVGALVYDATMHFLKGCDISSIGMDDSKDLLFTMSVLLRFKLLEQDKVQAFDDQVVSTFKAAAKCCKKNLLETETYLIDLICKQSADCGDHAVNEIKLSMPVYQRALDRLYQIFPHALRNSIEGESDGSNAESQLRNFFRQLRTVTFVLFSIDDPLPNIGFRHIKGWSISCLKHGINDKPTSVSSCCLQLLRLTLEWTKATNLILPSQIFFMAVSHSRFENLLAADKSESKKQLIHLLLTCVSQDTTIKAERSVFLSLLSGYDAGLQHGDKLMRLLLIRLHENYRLDQTSILPVSMSDLAWGELKSKREAWDENILVTPDHGSEWEWFLEGLDSRRILRTIHNFPTKEAVDTSLGTERSEFLNSSINMQMSNEESFVRYDSERIIDVDNDDRYDPEFIVPLTLGVLKAFLPEAESVSQREKYVLIAQRLCRKGVISLALASFAYDCPTLRQTSLGVIALLLQAIQMGEAHSLLSWKERPQLEMIMNSFQRGLLSLRRVDLSRKHDNVFQDSDGNFPQLPSLCTLFLAKSAWIISSPIDDLYPAINKFFLRLESDFGAYKDFYSLPAFISLFCSSSDDITYAGKERIWALQLLKEGVTDQLCLNIIIKKHVPELLMTTFDSLSSRSCINQANECKLILDTLHSIFDHGSSNNFPSMSNKLGLFPWILQMLNKLISMRHELVEKFYEFTRTCLLSYKRFVDPIESGTHSACFLNIARIVVSSAVDFAECENEYSVTQQHIQAIAGNILVTVHDIRKMSGISSLCHEHDLSCLKSGLSASSCVKFLNRFELFENVMQSRLTHSICSLPIDICERDPSVAYALIKRLLLILLQVSPECLDDSKNFLGDISNRVRLVIEFVPCNCYSKDLISSLWQVRRICGRNKASWDNWLASLSKLLNCSNNEEDIWMSTCSLR